MADDAVRVARDGRVLTITLDDPGTRNALSRELYELGYPAVRAAGTDDTIGAIVITGAGGTFCSGGNINRLEESLEQSHAERLAAVGALHAWIKAIRTCPKPVIAAVEGAAAGAGCSLALACDLIVAARDARFVVSHVKIGLNPDGGATAFLTRALPPQLAAELCLTGDPVAAVRLHELGVVNRLAEPGAALGDAMAWAQRLASGPTAALGRAKALIEAAQENDLSTQLELEARLVTEARDHWEAREGLNAFLEKRRPDFQGAARRATDEASG